MSDLREAANLALSTLTDSRIGTWSYMEGSEIYKDFDKAADALRAALSAEPAQEMTDTQVRAVVIEYLSSTKAHTDAWRRFTYDSGPYEVTCVRHDTMGLLRAVIAADRASRLPEMPDGDIKRLVCAAFPEPYYQERADKLVRAAVEAYKALVRGKT